MAELTIDMTYGNALFQAAKDVDKVALILEEGKQVLDVLRQEEDFRVFFNAPTISAGDKKAVLKTVFQGKICEELLNLLYILVDKGRSPHYEKIYKAYRKIVNQAEGFSCGHVYSAAPLNTTQIETLEAQTGKLMGKTVRLKNETDASLIGGVKVLIDGKIFDASIRKRLEDLEKTMK